MCILTIKTIYEHVYNFVSTFNKSKLNDKTKFSSHTSSLSSSADCFDAPFFLLSTLEYTTGSMT